MHGKRYLLLIFLFLFVFVNSIPVSATIKTNPIDPDSFLFKEIYPIIPKTEHRPHPTQNTRKTSPINKLIPVPNPNLSHFRKGIASYYCLAGKSRCSKGHSGGMYAAIRKDLLFLRGKTVQVCKYGTTKCIHVTIIDCNCGPHANLIDLYSDAFKKLTPLWKGVVKVTVKW